MPGNHFNLHAIKREARKEAWRNDSFNPFRKINRANTWNPPSPRDPANRDPERGDVAGDSARRPRHLDVSSDPGISSPVRDHDQYPNTNGDRKPETLMEQAEPEVTNAKTGGVKEDGSRSSDPESGATMVEKEITQTPSNEENKVRRRFKLRNPWKKDEQFVGEPEVRKEKKRPWYKGKDLPHPPFTVRNQLSATIFNSWINILIIAAPVGLGLHYAGVNGTVVFVVNFIAIIPLAAMLSFATEEIALHLGETLGGLLNASFGNAVELIVAVIALVKNEFIVVQTSLLGSILSNLLLVLGMCFFFGGLRREEQFFNQTVAQTAASLLALAVGSLIIPTAFDLWSTTTSAPIAAISRGTSVILLVVYASYLFFQLKTHSRMFNEESKKVPMKPSKHSLPEGALAKGLAKAGGIGAGAGRPQLENRPPDDELINPNATEDEDDEADTPQLHIMVAWATLAIATGIIGLCSEFMVDGISSITDDGVSVEFVGLILLPIVGNAAEHATAVTVACKDKMDLAIGVAVGSSMQVALFLIPLLVVIGWMMGKDQMNLSFDGFQIAVLFVAVLLVNYLIADGKSHWLEGMLLCCLYLIIAVCAWYYPATAAV